MFPAGIIRSQSHSTLTSQAPTTTQQTMMTLLNPPQKPSAPPYRNHVHSCVCAHQAPVTLRPAAAKTISQAERDRKRVNSARNTGTMKASDSHKQQDF